MVVPDVELFPGHMACGSAARSEIVVPLRDAEGRARGVLDIDSRELDAFDAVDQENLEAIAAIVSSAL